MSKNGQTIVQALEQVSLATEMCLEAAGITIECGNGCTACCKQPVVVSVPEAKLAWEAYQQRASLKAIKTFKKRFTKDIAALKGVTTPDEYMFKRIECPFLKNGACSVYEARPKVCRTMVSEDRSICEQDLVLGRNGQPGIPDEDWTRTFNLISVSCDTTISFPPEQLLSQMLIQIAISNVLNGSEYEPGAMVVDEYTAAFYKKFRDVREVYEQLTS